METTIKAIEKRGSKDLALSPDERTLLLEKLTEAKHRIILILGSFAGLRVSEISQCRLSWLEWKNFNGKKVLAINIPAEDRDSRNKYKKWFVKNTSKKTLDLNSMRIITEDKSRTTYIFELEYSHEIYFWFKVNPDGLKMSRQNITQKIIKIHFDKIINRHITTHALRSTYQNYLLYEKNFEPKFIAIVMGHSDIRTTMKHYNSMNKASAESYIIGLMKND